MWRMPLPRTGRAFRKGDADLDQVVPRKDSGEILRQRDPGDERPDRASPVEAHFGQRVELPLVG